jgi:hypothetical protein
MEIEKSIRIMDLKSGWSITRDDGRSEVITIATGAADYELSKAEVRELIEAFQIALGEKGGKSEPALGFWDRVEDIPANVLQVMDREDDLWTRSEDGQFRYGACQQDDMPHYAPFRAAES